MTPAVSQRPLEGFYLVNYTHSLREVCVYLPPLKKVTSLKEQYVSCIIYLLQLEVIS